VQEHSHGSDVPLQIRSERKRSVKSSDFDAITIRDEQWRYLHVDRLAGLNEALSPYSGSLEGANHASVASAKSSRGEIGLPEDLVAANVWEASTEVKTITIEGENEIQVLNVSNSGEKQALQLFIEARPFSTGTVVINHTGTGSLAEIVEVKIGDEANVSIVSVQNLEEGATFTSSHFAKLARNSKLKHVVVSIGGKTIRVVPSVTFSGPGASVEMLGAYFANGDQHIEHRPFVDHNQPNCVSDVTYKGALQGAKAHTVWVGDVLIRKAAEGTKTYELNRNLLLTDGARADSVPNLEIETGQIEGAGHASASGRFDDEQLFYLQARGITERDAKRLVVKGFLNDVISKIGVPELEDQLNGEIEEKLERTAK
jgi:Fe-S cluster assembly protein SufD